MSNCTASLKIKTQKALPAERLLCIFLAKIYARLR